MRVRKLFRSLRLRMYVFSVALFLAVTVILVYNNLAASNILRAEVCAEAQRVLAISQRRLDDTLSSTAAYLATFAYQNVEVETIQRTTPASTAYHVSIERIRRQFANTSPGYTMDSFFFYDPAQSLYFANVNDIHSPVRGALTASDALTAKQNAGKWFILQADGDDYLVRYVRVSHSYIGAWVRVRSLLRQVQKDQLMDNEVYLLDQHGRFLSADAPLVELDPQANLQSGDFTFVDIGGRRYLAVTRKIRLVDYYLTALIPDASIANRQGHLTWVIIVASAGAFLLFILGAAVLRRWIVRPVAQLTAAIRALQNGDFQASLPQNTYDEFQEVNRAFNTATEEIKALKIDMYEERLHKQRIQMQYLQSQIAPHFLINCLNTVYQLTDTNQPALTHAMLRTLSQHLRYTLSSSEMVSLAEELRHVENYLELSAIRYPESIVLVKEYDPAVQDARVIPLLIQTFVENTVKYEAVVGKRLEIHILTSMVREQSRQSVHIGIWDTGGGFDPQILADLQNIPVYLQKHGSRHIGIGNIFQRADILFAECRFAFSNRAGAGAQIDITIPYISFDEGAHPDESADR